jgi:uncharacterized protein YggE
MKNKKWLIFTVLFGIIMFAVGGYWALSSQKVSADVSCTSTTAKVSVIGVAKQDVTPDRAIITINVVGEDKDANKAMEVMKESAQYVLDIAKTYTDEKHITTTGLSLRQSGHWEKDKYVYDKFIASEVIKIDVAVDKVGELAGKITADRAENVRLSGISFYYTKADEVRKSLLEKAILDAQDNAIRLVKPLGAEHISLVSVSYGGYNPVPVQNDLRYEAAKVVADVPISAGSQTISVQVSAVFEAGPVCTSIEK